MTAYLAMLLVKILDPISFLICLFVAIKFKQIEKSKLLVASIAVALLIEGFLSISQGTRVFGEGLIAGIPASMIHMLLAYFFANKKMTGQK